MSLLTYFRGVYARYKAKRALSAWESDWIVFLKTKPDPYCLEGIELALLHLSKVTVPHLSVQQRRTMKVYSAVATVDDLLSLLVTIRMIVLAGDSMPEKLLPSENSQTHRRVDDFFTSTGGHIVSIEKIRVSLEGRIDQLISALRQLEADGDSHYQYYDRKLRPLYRDLYYVLLALHQTSCR